MMLALVLVLLGCSTCEAHTAQFADTFLSVCVAETYHLTNPCFRKAAHCSAADDAVSAACVTQSGASDKRWHHQRNKT